MPGGDRSGPMGKGPKTGKGLGNCEGEPANQTPGRGYGPGRGFGGGFGRGAGRGFGRGFWCRGRGFWQQPIDLSKEEKKKILEAEKEQIEKELKEL